MKTQIKEIYKCDFCNKLYQVKSACEKHEKVCTKNPINDRICHHCWHLDKKTTQIDNSQSDYQTGETVLVDRDFFYCNYKHIFLYTPQNEMKQNFKHTDSEGGYLENFPMPISCDCKDKGVDFLK